MQILLDSFLFHDKIFIYLDIKVTILTIILS